MALAALLATVAAGTAEAATSRLVYTDYAAPDEGDFHSDVFVVRADGTHLHRVTHGPADDYTPAWAPRRRSIAFARSNDAPSHLFTVRANGTHLHRIPRTKFGFDPSWSPNGRRLAFTISNSHGKAAVFTMRLNGTHRRRLTGYSASITSPDWSPNGKSIVYQGRDGITRMRANGHHKIVVSSSGESPSWSPNGRRIAFSDAAESPDAVTDVYTIKVNGTGRHDVTGARQGTSCPDEPGECSREDLSPGWSPSGRRISFSETSSGNGDVGIFTLRPDGSGTRHVTTSGNDADW